MSIYSALPLRKMSWLFLYAFIAISFLSITSCKRSPRLINVDPAFSKYIEAYTSGVVSKKTAIRIQFASEVPVTHSLYEPLQDALFKFTPAVNGKTYWIDARTIEFKPEADLASDELYVAEFDLAKVLDVPSAFKQFRFNMQVAKPAYQIEDLGLRSDGKEKMNFSGKLSTADVEHSADVEKMLNASLNGASVPVKWQHNETDKTHLYFIEGIGRGKNAGVLQLNWTGDPIHAKATSKKEIAIPAIGDFKVLEVKAVQEDEQYVLVSFSDPIMNNEQLEGLVTVSNQENLSYTTAGSTVKVYSPTRFDGSYTVTVNEGITNEWAGKLPKAFTANVFFENRLPAVKIQGKGVVLPNNGGRVLLPFEAINLKAVDISIIKIFENNVPQFLQSNTLGGNNDLRKVAQPLVQATLKLDEDKSLDLHRKNRFFLDIDKYIKTEPGAIYSVHIGFRPTYSVYGCPEMVKPGSGRDYDEAEYGQDGAIDDFNEFWKRYNTYYPYGYDWKERENPCNHSYYNQEHFASRNIIATNIGLTVKKGSSNNLFIVANDIISTDPIIDVDIKLLDYQLQVIGKTRTGKDGIAMIEAKRKPYLLIANKGIEKSYLRIDDGASLPLARFDVSGAEIKNGIKGFVFGERGVWRPGDSLFIGSIIEDKTKKLPADHPVEMELFSPNGQLYKRLVATSGEDGFTVFKTVTDPSVPTGNWLCRIKAGGAVFEKTIKIETVIPNRLKINLDFGRLAALGKNAGTNGTLSARWLFGATAKNLKARVDAQLYRKPTTFPAFKDFVFDNPVASFTPQSKTIFDGTLNADGIATVSPSFDAGKQAPGMLLANLTVKVFEPGGNFSIDNIALPYHPFSSYAGIKTPEGDKQWGFLLSGKTHRFDLVDVNTDGSLVNGSTKVELSLYKIQWRWWWDNTDDELSNFTQDQYNKLIKKEAIVLDQGKGSFQFKLPEGNFGRYLVLVKDMRSGHITGKVFFVDDYDWQSRADKNDGGAAAMLSFTSDKPSYDVGEEVKLTIPSSEGGRALISIETGSKVLKTFWANTAKGETKFSFRADKEMCPNVYVNVTLIQPHAQTINDLPIRMYGVIPVLVNDKSTVLNPQIQISSEIRPEQRTAVTVSEPSGRKMSYTIAIVDEGLLDLTRFKTPDPHEGFYAKEALGVKSWDLYDYVIGAWGSELQRILTIGGDAANDLPSKTRKANRFKPVVQFLGPFKYKGRSQTHYFTLPAYMGSVRVMVIAAGDGAYGKAEKAVTVKKPLMLLASLPRVLGPSEKIKIPVTVFATTPSVKQVTLSLQSNPFIAVSGSQTLNFSNTGEQLVYFDATVKNAVGIGKFTLTAISGKEKTSYNVEIDIRNPNPLLTKVTEASLEPGQHWSGNIDMIGTAADSKATLEISSIPAINLQQRLNYLIEYPHGCIEQTTSAVFPQLLLDQLTELSDARKKEITRNIRIAIQKIQNFQASDGGFGYWQGNPSDEWGTNYAGHFLLEAAAKGYDIPSGLLQQWRMYEKNKAHGWNITQAPVYGSDLVQAYRLYLLALAKAPETGAMNRLREYKFLSVEAKWRLAAAYYLAGQSQAAIQMISGLPLSFPARSSWGITYGSDTRDEAMVLETLTLMNRRTEAVQLVRSIAAKLSQDNWYSTQTTAYCLLAIAKFSGTNSNGSKINATARFNGKTIGIQTGSVISQTTAQWQGNSSSIQLNNKGNNMLYVRVINEGIPPGNAVPLATNNPDILQVTATYMTTAGVVIDPTKIKQGTDFVAKVTVRNPGKRGYYSEMALTQLFPGGWEILNTRLLNSEGAFKSSPSKYMDIRDDRVYHYFNIGQGETLNFYVQLNAAYPGKYLWAGVHCEAMYDHTINGGISGKWVEVE